MQRLEDCVSRSTTLMCVLAEFQLKWTGYLGSVRDAADTHSFHLDWSNGLTTQCCLTANDLMENSDGGRNKHCRQIAVILEEGRFGYCNFWRCMLYIYDILSKTATPCSARLHNQALKLLKSVTLYLHPYCCRLTFSQLYLRDYSS